MDAQELFGWVKLHRRFLTSPVWKNQNASRLLVWILCQPNHRRRVEYRGGVRYDLTRGQVLASLADMVEGTGLSTKAVRNALEFLRVQETIRRRESVITVVNFPKYQGSDTDDAPGEEGEERKEAGAGNKGQGKGQRKGQGENGKKGKAGNSENATRDKGKTPKATVDRASRIAAKGQRKGQGKGHAINKVEEVIKKTTKKTDPPNPPFPKGGRVDASPVLGTAGECRDMVLAMWGDAWAAAGAPLPAGVSGRNNTQGAERLAREYLQSARLTVGQLRAGMAKLVGMIRADPKCGRMDLRTLANNPDKYCPPVVVPKAARRLFIWEFVCDVCGATCATGAVPRGEAPPAQPCIRAGSGCQGTMCAGAPKEVEV